MFLNSKGGKLSGLDAKLDFILPIALKTADWSKSIQSMQVFTSTRLAVVPMPVLLSVLAK